MVCSTLRLSGLVHVHVSAVPVMSWNHGPEEQDKWSKTYVSANKTTPPAGPTATSAIRSSTSASTNIPATVTTRKFPRPKSTSSIASGHLSRGVSEHILATTGQSPRSPSPLKFSTTFADSAPDIIPSLSSNGPTLSKVYGSVLQPKESLPLHSCAICLNVFPPDATIYPNPADDVSDGKSFLCRQCFTANGGSKGNCPSCSRPVLALKAEGGFVHSGGKYWHKGCFTCVGCFKNIGNTPMVDLFGRPTCADCFDNCLKRDHPATPKKNRTSNNNSPISSSATRLSSSRNRKSRENSPMIDELEQRLGIVRSRESSPAVVDSARHIVDSSKRRASVQVESPQSRRYSNLDDKLSFDTCQQSVSSCRTTILQEPESPLRRLVSHAEIQPSQRILTPDKRHSSTPEKLHSRDGNKPTDLSAVDLRSLSTTLFTDSSAKKASRTSNTPCSPFMDPDSSSTLKTSSCMKCQQPVLNLRQGGQFVTIPGNDENDSPKLFHNDCLKCSICEKPLSDSKKGQASFVLASVGPCHTQVRIHRRLCFKT